MHGEIYMSFIDPKNKDKKQKRGGFFSVSDAIPQEETVGNSVDEIIQADEQINDDTSVVAAVAEPKNAFVKKVAIFLLALGALIAAIIVISNMDFAEEGKYGLPEEMLGNGTPYTPDLRLPDWDTDIFTLEEYLDLQPDKIRYKAGGEVFYLYKDTVNTKGRGITFLNKYLNAVKSGDHEAVNSMYSADYLKKDGVEKHEKFPMQKIFDISVELRNDIRLEEDEALERSYDIYYFVLRYKILRNDGYFRDDIDQHYSSAQLVKVLIDDDGKGIIDDIWAIPAYTGDE